MQVNDEQLEVSDIRRLESADEIAHFFAKLRYDVDERTNIPDYAALGMGSEDMRQHIHKIESGDSSELAPRLPCKGKSVRNRGVSQTMPFLVIHRSLLRGGFI
jgi:hypothetical protein